MFQQYSTALIALSANPNNQSLLQALSQLKIHVINRIQINTKESIYPEVENHKPNFLILSSSLPGVVDATNVIQKVKQTSPKTKTILIVNENDPNTILNYFLSSPDAIVGAENNFESLETTIKQLSKGQAFLCGKSLDMLRTVLQTQKIEEKSDLGLLNLLTDRETEVLESLTQGINYKQIAKQLFISESTVKTHINNIFTKLNVNDRTQAVLYALHHGIESVSKKPQILKNFTDETVKQK